MNDDEILAILKFLHLELSTYQLHSLLPYVDIKECKTDTDDRFKVYIVSRRSDKIKCWITITNLESR